jgi:hypothetical protein
VEPRTDDAETGHVLEGALSYYYGWPG